MRYEVTDIESIGDFIDKLCTHIGDYLGPVWYRGHSVSGWNLEPKLMRIADRPPETHYLNKFKQDASIILNRYPKNEFEWLFLMQHYGVPTRLLDWTESPLTGLYRSEEHTSELQSLMRISYAVFCLKKKKKKT